MLFYQIIIINYWWFIFH